MEREVKEKEIVATTPTGFSAAEPKAGPEVQLLKSAKKKYCFTRNTSCNDLDEEYELKTGSILTERVNLVFTDPPYSNRSARS